VDSDRQEEWCTCRLCLLDDAQLREEIGKLCLEGQMQVMKDHGLTVGEDIELRQRAWELYAEHVPLAVEIAAGEHVREAMDPEGRPIEIVPSYCTRILALDMLARCGLGTMDADEARKLLTTLRDTLDRELRNDLGLSLEEVRPRCQEAGPS
jgi:hypothetical protein